MLGELDRVADQIDEDLPHADRIGLDRLGNRSAVFRPARKAAFRRPVRRISDTTSATMAAGEQVVRSTASLPASIFDRSRISLMIRNRYCPFRWMVSTISRSSGVEGSRRAGRRSPGWPSWACGSHGSCWPGTRPSSCGRLQRPGKARSAFCCSIPGLRRSRKRRLRSLALGDVLPYRGVSRPGRRRPAGLPTGR